MNRDYILFNLCEAREQLDQTIRDIEADPEYDFGEFLVDMAHTYGHLNTAWNAREVTAERAERCSDEDFEEWRKFPTDLDLIDGRAVEQSD